MEIFESFKDIINEVETRPGDSNLVTVFQNAMYKMFGQLSYYWGTKANMERYDYSNSHVHISNTYMVENFKWCDSKVADVLTNCGFSSPRIIMKYIYTEVITPERGKFIPSIAEIYLSGKDYKNFMQRMEIENPLKIKMSDFTKMANKFLSESRKGSKNLPDDVLNVLFSLWGSSKIDYKDIGSRHQGIGKHTSVHVTKSYEAVYNIKGLEIIFGNNRQKCEDYISKHYMFTKRDLMFDWDNGFMIVNGKYTEVWD